MKPKEIRVILETKNGIRKNGKVFLRAIYLIKIHIYCTAHLHHLRFSVLGPAPPHLSYPIVWHLKLCW